MHPQLLAPFAEYAAALSKHPARFVVSADGRGTLQSQVGSTFLRLQITGRPDGVYPAGADTTLALLRTRITAATRVQPQDWMELDREFALYQHRSRCALSAAVDACQHGRFDLAIRMCRLSCDDVTHQLGIIELAHNAHPAGGLPGAGATQPATLRAQQCVAEALPNMIANGVAAGQNRLRRGAEELTQALANQGEANANAHPAVRRLIGLAAALNAGQTTPVANPTTPLAH